MHFVSVLLLAILASSFNPTSTELSSLDVKTVFLVRHAEKCTAPESDPDLTSYGRERVAELVRVLQHVELDAIYSTPFARTLNTARPVAEAHDVMIVETPPARGFLEAMTERIKNGEAHNILVSGHSNTTPRMANLLGGTSFEDLDESVYDRLYVVTIAGDESSVQVLTFGGPSGESEDCG